MKMLLTLLRLAVKRQPALYRVLASLPGVSSMRTGSLPGLQTQFVVEGYPSSGNTFARRLGGLVFDEDMIASHTHSVASLKIALQYNLPCVALVRPPLEAISSYVVRYGVTVGAAIMEYVDFYSYVERSSHVKTVCFNQLVSNPEEILLIYAALGKRELSREQAVQLAKKEYLDLVVTRNRQLETTAGDISIGWKTPEKEALKEGVKESIRVHPKYPPCELVYAELLG